VDIVSSTKQKTEFIGFAAIVDKDLKNFRLGKAFATIFPPTKTKLAQFEYAIVDEAMPIFTLGSGGTVQDMVNDFMTQSHENGRIALIDPKIFNKVMHEIEDARDQNINVKNI
jgi:hypothetical protein